MTPSLQMWLWNPASFFLSGLLAFSIETESMHFTSVPSGIRPQLQRAAQIIGTGQAKKQALLPELFSSKHGWTRQTQTSALVKQGYPSMLLSLSRGCPGYATRHITGWHPKSERNTTGGSLGTLPSAHELASMWIHLLWNQS